MKQFTDRVTPGNVVECVQEMRNARREDIDEVKRLQQGKLPGRLRNGVRAIPSSPADVGEGDQAGDMVNDNAFLYLLVSISGSVRWHRVALSVGW